MLKTHLPRFWPSYVTELPIELQPYWAMKDNLYTVSGIPFKGKKMLIPKSLCAIILERLHAAHQRVNSMLATTCERFFWPSLDTAIRLYRAQCCQCNKQAPFKPKELAIESIQPEVPFEKVAADFCKISDFSYLIFIDAYSGWIEVANLTGTGFHIVGEMLLMYFAIFGVPEEIGTDGGLPFDCGDYINLLKKWNIRRSLSWLYCLQSNRRADIGVKTAKRMLLGNINPWTGKLDNGKAVKVLMAHWNAPCQQTGTSPAVVLFGKPIRDYLPIPNLNLRQEWQEIADKREEALEKRYLIQKLPQPEPKELPPLQVRDSVQIQKQYGSRLKKWNSTGFVTEVLPHRQYCIMVDGSRWATLRNRWFLKKIFPICRETKEILLEPLHTRTLLTPSMDMDKDLKTPIQPAPPPPELITPKREDSQHPQVLVNSHPIPSLDEESRQSTCTRHPPRPLSLKLTGQLHDWYTLCIYISVYGRYVRSFKPLKGGM